MNPCTDGEERFGRLCAAVREILCAVGEDPTRPGLKATPERVARAWDELTAGYREDPAHHLDRSFPIETTEARHGIVLVRDIPFYSLCEHHMLPFHGVAHVGYVPGDRLVGLSKIARCVKGYAARLQVQERMTEQVVDAMQEKLEPKGVAVVVKAEHLCMGMRGVRVDGTLTTTSAVRGVFWTDQRARAEVLKLME